MGNKYSYQHAKKTSQVRAGSWKMWPKNAHAGTLYIVRLQKSTMQFVPLYELALNSRLRQIALTFMNTYFFSNKKVTF